MPIAYLILVNAAAFALMFADKQKAIRGQWRIPEKVLLGVALLGGSIGAIAGMYTFRHKIRHGKFKYGLPLILLVQLYLLGYGFFPN
jgi:uncharacterized membrane protein YsdA (DUF1294 family)